ncbi:hypothetical protein [Enterobacter ludwigii]|uniref:hypothetical protein n=1 Tax=Enterobacter ludwigii TaxID=299767 RepID=UPI003F70392E
MEYHDNEVDFCLWFNDDDLGYKIKSAGYNIPQNGYIVTPGQDPDNEMKNQMNQPMIISGDKRKGTLFYKLGRHNSQTVDDWVNARVDPRNQSIGQKFGNIVDSPRSFDGNFAFIGVLTLELTGGLFFGTTEKIIFEDFFLSQTHPYGTTANLWAYGGKQAKFNESGFYACKFSNVKGENGCVLNVDMDMPIPVLNSTASYHINIESISFPTVQPIK